jgi:hypothetical protein
MYEQIAPLIIRYDPKDTWNAVIKTQGSTQKAIQEIEKVTKKLNPAFPFRYEFVDETYAQSYRNERTVSTLLDYFAIVCIFISCLGLLGSPPSQQINVQRKSAFEKFSVHECLTLSSLFRGITRK